MSSGPNDPSYEGKQEREGQTAIPPLPPEAPSVSTVPQLPPYEPATPYAAPEHFQQPPVHYGAPAPYYPSREELARGAASNSLTMGVIGAVLAIIIGWIPIFGIVGVAGGIGLGVPAIIHAKRAEENGVNATAGKVLGWVSIAFSALWVVLYVSLILIGATDSHGR